MRFHELSETHSILRQVDDAFRRARPWPIFDFVVSRGFWLQLPFVAAMRAAEKGRSATTELLARAYATLRWAAFARGYELTSVVVNPDALSSNFALCGAVAERPASVGYDSEGCPCEKWPR
jgi:hypothetical protein